MGGAAVALADDQLGCVDDAAVLHNVAGDSVVVLDRLRWGSLQAVDLCGECCLVAAETSEDLLSGYCIGFVDRVVGAVSGAVVTVETKRASTSKIGLRDGASNQLLTDDSGRAQQSAYGACASTAANL